MFSLNNNSLNNPSRPLFLPTRPRPHRRRHRPRHRHRLFRSLLGGHRRIRQRRLLIPLRPRRNIVFDEGFDLDKEVIVKFSLKQLLAEQKKQDTGEKFYRFGSGSVRRHRGRNRQGQGQPRSNEAEIDPEQPRRRNRSSSMSMTTSFQGRSDVIAEGQQGQGQQGQGQAFEFDWRAETNLLMNRTEQLQDGDRQQQREWVI